jgi:DnaJ domain
LPEIVAAIALLALFALFSWHRLTRAMNAAARAQVMRYIAVGGLVLLGIILAISGRDILDLPVGALIVWLARGWFAQGFPGLKRLKAWLDGKSHQEAGPKREETARAPDAAMTETEAWQVLGLAPGASRDAIREAHRNLITKLHPDRGGTTYLARQINAARDILLRN